jgi:hypothetical protein
MTHYLKTPQQRLPKLRLQRLPKLHLM